MGTITESTGTVSNKPRVLLVSPLPPPEGGIASWTQRILASEAMQGVTLHHLNTSVGGGHHRLGASPLKRLARSVFPLPRFVWARSRRWPSIIHITSSGFPGYYRDMFYIFFASLLGRKVVVNLRFGDIDAFLQGTPGILRPLVHASLRICWWVVPITQPMAKVVQDLGCTRVEVIPNCVDIRSYSEEKGTDALERELRVLYVGWVIPAKGITELLKAVAQVDGTTLTITGPLITQKNDSHSQWLNNAIAVLGLKERVTLVGRVESEVARRTYQRHDVFVLPSHREGFPNVVLEAMEAGIPVIATRVGAIPEIVRDSVDGFLIDVGNTDALSGYLKWFMDHPDERVRMGRSAKERVITQYSTERIASLWINLYKRATVSS